ncbi:DUF7344 domain-containing protein [Halopelagius longus]|uniref:DUF7344 domain-containing protein n=1 Tax=Halopelagius longus TaxID=1236180 RepID=A0A1H1FR63_9EURY|nr:helix-turn-helix transcriptional regulator [Halopelagius longus]RDI70203.1 hypothetical protein DWB78_16450 [Halopelagius longus]SDR03401.1 hypothetical protein SAMN05216278_3364 [Halopelagius longus]
MAINQDGISSGQPTGDYLAALDNKYRRAVVDILAEKDRPVTRSSLVKQVTAEVQDAEQDPDQMEIELHHNHLPKLDEAGLLDYWPEDGCATATQNLKTAAELIETIVAK